MKKVRSGLFITAIVMLLGLLFLNNDTQAELSCVNGAIDADIYAPAYCVAGGLGCRICTEKKAIQ